MKTSLCVRPCVPASNRNALIIGVSSLIDRTFIYNKVKPRAYPVCKQLSVGALPNFDLIIIEFRTPKPAKLMRLYVFSFHR